MNEIKAYKEMIEILKDTLEEVCEQHGCMEYYDGCMLVLEDIAENAQQKLDM